MATVPRVVARSLLPSAMSLSQVLFQASAIAGPALAGVIIATAGLSWAYAVDALTAVIDTNVSASHPPGRSAKS